MKRIAIIGSGGSGKSTLARQLGAILSLEVTHLDSIFWRPGWTKTPLEEWTTIQQELVQKETWIMDGNFGGTQHIRLEAADTVIFLDLPRHTCLWRIIKRWYQYAGRSRPDLAPGCPEKLGLSFLAWIWNYRRRSRPSILERLKRYAQGRRIVVIGHPREVRQFLNEAELEKAASSAQIAPKPS
ncbi:MAG: DNA topology modulation protein [Dehalococcoidia bacterium]|nr:DNA topology modulation protein [Dehalococcoidia bacterium]